VVKNRSHNQKQQIQNYKVSFPIRLAVFQAAAALTSVLYLLASDLCALTSGFSQP